MLIQKRSHPVLLVAVAMMLAPVPGRTQSIITTVAGNGSIGFSGDGGPATSATLGLPTGVAVDSAGNIYIADGLNNRVRKVTKDGVITTVAETGSRFSPVMEGRPPAPESLSLGQLTTLAWRWIRRGTCI